DKIKGSSARLITIPGYHIHPKYDLTHTRHILEERRNKKKGFALMLAPMVDMFSILVIYLLMNFSSNGDAFFVSKNVVLPKGNHGAPMKSLPLLSIVNGNVMFDADNSMGIPTITTEELNDEKVPQLREMLRKLKTVEEQIGEKAENKGQVNVQADEGT